MSGDASKNSLVANIQADSQLSVSDVCRCNTEVSFFRTLESYCSIKEGMQWGPEIHCSMLPLFMQRSQQYSQKQLIYGLAGIIYSCNKSNSLSQGLLLQWRWHGTPKAVLIGPIIMSLRRQVSQVLLQQLQLLSGHLRDIVSIQQSRWADFVLYDDQLPSHRAD